MNAFKLVRALVVAQVVSYLMLVSSCSSNHESSADVSIEQRETAIKEELATLTDHEWAGEYYQGDGLGSNDFLSISPKGGAVLRGHACVGFGEMICGTTSEKNGVVRISWKLSLRTEGDGPSPEFLVVRWGARRYLVPTEKVLEFCLSVRSNREPRKEVHGRFYLRTGDERKRADGKLELPAGFEQYLTMKPIEASVTDFGRESVTLARRPQQQDEVAQNLTLNVGRADGVLPRMTLEDRSSLGIWIRVQKVREHECEGHATFGREVGAKEPSLKRGLRVSTRQ